MSRLHGRETRVGIFWETDDPPFRGRWRCALRGHDWQRVGSFVHTYGNGTNESFPVRRCARCRVGHPSNPETTTFGGAT